MFLKKLTVYRKEISRLDLEILALLAERKKVASKIGALKREYSLSIEDEAQEKKVLEGNLKSAEKLDLERDLVERITKELISAAKQNQRNPNEVS